MSLVRETARGACGRAGSIQIWSCPSLGDALESWPSLLLVAALRRVGLLPYPNSIEELASEAWVQVSWAEGMKAGDLTCFLPTVAPGCLARGVLESSFGWCGQGGASSLTS